MEDIAHMLRKCDVHFKRARTRIAKKDVVIPAEKKELFYELTDKLCEEHLTFQSFDETCHEIVKEFPLTLSWLLWYLRGERAMCFFPACQNFTKEQIVTFGFLESTTNAQENIGRQFQHLAPKKKTAY